MREKSFTRGYSGKSAKMPVFHLMNYHKNHFPVMTSSFFQPALPPSIIPALYAFRLPIQPHRDFIQHIGKSSLTIVREHIRTPLAPSVPILPVTRNLTQLWGCYKIARLVKYAHFRDFAKRGMYRTPFTLIGARSKPGLTTGNIRFF
jgi:hypothetical protein